MAKKRRDFVPGYHAVRETLLAGVPAAETLWVVSGKWSKRAEELRSLARQRGIPVMEIKSSEFDRLAPGVAHQGVALSVAGFEYKPLEEVIERTFESDSHGLILALDHITDEGNFGAIMRTAAFFGAEAIVIPKDRSVRVTPSVIKRSSGAHSSVQVCRVVNLSRALVTLKRVGLWIVGSAGEAPLSFYEFDWCRPSVLVMGNERKGLGASVRKICDELVAVPGKGSVESLNVSVAAGVLLSEIARQRLGVRPESGHGF